MMEQMLDRAELPRHCVADLRRIIAKLKQNSEEVSLGHVVYDHTQLPPCIGQLTFSKASKTKKPIFSVPVDWADRSVATRKEREVLNDVNQRLHGTAGKESVSKYVKKRADLPLSAKEQDFIYRYAEYKHGTNVRNEEKKHTNTLAYRAYTEAFLSFTGRQPSDIEIREADRLPFVKTADGTVGVVRRPRSSFPRRLVLGSTSARVASATRPKQL
jgi:hypothetical protein